MLKRKLILLSLLFSGCFSQMALAQKEKIENAVFWQISGKGIGKPSYLFGTYHVLNSSYLEEIPSVKAAFEKSDGIAVEMVLDSSKLQQVMFGMLGSKKPLSSLLKEEEYELVATEVKEVTGTDLKAMDQLKPAFITLMLTMAYHQQENQEYLTRYTGTPVDIHFASQAKQEGKQVIAFESMEEQFAILFNHDSVEKQADQLLAFVKAKEEMKKSQKTLATLYFNQDLKGMYELFSKYTEEFGDASHLLDDRNEKWMEKLPSLLQTGNQFIAVGALHFVGEKGLIKLLRSAGYTVKPMPLK